MVEYVLKLIKVSPSKSYTSEKFGMVVMNAKPTDIKKQKHMNVTMFR